MCLLLSKRKFYMRRNGNSERYLFNSTVFSVSLFQKNLFCLWYPNRYHSVAITTGIKLIIHVNCFFYTRGILINTNVTIYCLLLSPILLSNFEPNLHNLRVQFLFLTSLMPCFNLLILDYTLAPVNLPKRFSRMFIHPLTWNDT